MALHRPGARRDRTIVRPGRRSLLEPHVPAARPARFRDPELDAMRAADRARDRELHPLSDRNKRRLRFYVLGAMVYFPLVTFVFSTAPLASLWLQLPIAAAYGAFVHFRRPGGVMAALTAVLAGSLTQLFAGVSMGAVGTWNYTLSMFVYGAAGLILGITQANQWLDGE